MFTHSSSIGLTKYCHGQKQVEYLILLSNYRRDYSVGAARERFQLPSEAWSDFEDAISRHRAEKQQPYRNLKHAILSIKDYTATHKRTAVATAVLILVLSFFTLVPTGRPLAKVFFNMIIQIVEDRIEITNQNPTYKDSVYDDIKAEEYLSKDNNDIDDNNEVEGMVSYPSLEQFVKEAGFIPIAIKADWLTCQTINYLDSKEIDKGYSDCLILSKIALDL